jgi:hypothetical protein
MRPRNSKTRDAAPHFDPFGFGRNMLNLTYLMAESQAVIGMRLLGMIGAFPVGPTENKRMVAEKVRAMGEASFAMWYSTLAMQHPNEVVAAGLKPFRSKTRANSRRLIRRGQTMRR